MLWKVLPKYNVEYKQILQGMVARRHTELASEVTRGQISAEENSRSTESSVVEEMAPMEGGDPF